MPLDSKRFVLRRLSMPARLAIASFLFSVGIGYLAALVHMHFQHASPGNLLPDLKDTQNAFHGRNGMTQLERLLTADEWKPFNGSGTMRNTFTVRSAGWKGAISRRAREKKISLRQAESQLRSERDGERLALLAWIGAGASKEAFEADAFPLLSEQGHHPITAEFVDINSDGTPHAKIASIFAARCARCHQQGAGGPAAQIPLETWEEVHAYCEVDTRAGGMSVQKLAQSTHVHLLSLSVLYGLTGLLFTFTTYPGWVRGVLAPLPLLAQLAEISCWWLARMDPSFGAAIV